MRLDAQLRELAAPQHGLVAAFQVRALGASSTELTRLRTCHEWHEHTPGLLVLRGSPDTRAQRLMAAVLESSPGAAISHGPAASMWGLPRFEGSSPEVTRHRGISRRAATLAVVHEVSNIPSSHVKVLDGIPCTSPARTAFDVAYGLPKPIADRVVDWFWTEGLMSGAMLDRVVDELACRGRSGSTVMRELAAKRGPDYIPPASGLEARCAQILERNCLGVWLRQVDCGGDEWVGRVDFRHERYPIVLEVQSMKYHAALTDRAADATRHAALRSAGFDVIEIWDHEVWYQPDVVAERVRTALERAQRADRAATRHP
jgi:hypothetical protein